MSEDTRVCRDSSSGIEWPHESLWVHTATFGSHCRYSLAWHAAYARRSGASRNGLSFHVGTHGALRHERATTHTALAGRICRHSRGAASRRRPCWYCYASMGSSDATGARFCKNQNTESCAREANASARVIFSRHFAFERILNISFVPNPPDEEVVFC